MDVKGGQKEIDGGGVGGLGDFGKFMGDECVEYSLYKSWDSYALKGGSGYGGVQCSPSSPEFSDLF